MALLIALFLSAGTGFVAAHAPLSAGANEGLAAATLISSPEKSFAIYTMLDPDGAPQYYRFPMQKGQVLYGSLMVPGPDSPVPDLVIIGPGIEPSGTIPPTIEVPAGSRAMQVPGEFPGKPSYEPFTPQPVYEVARFNLTVPENGDYFIAVTGPGGAEYSLAPGFREEFTAAEWLLVPWSVVSIRLWEGQSPDAVVAPLAAVVIFGLVLVLRRRKNQGMIREPVFLLLLVAGFLYLGGAVMTGVQTVYTVLLTGYSAGVLLTLVFMAGPVLLGMVIIRAVLRSRPGDFSVSGGLAMAVTGILGLLLWAGLLIGPLLALAGAAVILVRSAGHPRPA